MKIFKLTIQIFYTAFVIIFFNQVGLAQDNKEHTYDVSQKKMIVYENNFHITDLTANKYIGTWIWKKGDNLLKITLKKDTHNFGSKDKPALMDLLIGGYQYIKDGKEVANTLATHPITGNTQGEKSFLYLLIDDPKNDQSSIPKYTEYTLTFIDNLTVKLELSKRKHEGSLNNNDLSIPIDITLNRVN